MSKPTLQVSLLATGAILGVFHYYAKPAPDEQQIRQLAESVYNSTEWKGQIAPDFELDTIQGDHFRLSDNVGKKIIVLNFFATWCGPCRAEMPELNTYFNARKGEPFILLGIDAEENKNEVADFVSDMKLDFPVGVDAGPIHRQYGVNGLPTSVLIGVDGKVQLYEAGSLANAEVVFDGLMRQNLELLRTGKVIGEEEYRIQAQKQPALPTRKGFEAAMQPQEQLDPRAQQIAARMDCPCGCEKKVQSCVCNTSSKIKKALASGEFKDMPEDEVVKTLNKRFCSVPM